MFDSQIFDPVRSLMVQGRMLDWFDYRGNCWTCTINRALPNTYPPEFKLYKWLRVNAIDRLSITFHIASDPTPPPTEEIWKERKEAVGAMKAYLTDMPCMCKIDYNGNTFTNSQF